MSPRRLIGLGAAREHWARLTARERFDAVWQWHQLILDHSDDLAVIHMAEMGKPLAEAKSEIDHAAAYLQWYTEEANRICGGAISAPSNDPRMLVIRRSGRWSMRVLCPRSKPMSAML